MKVTSIPARVRSIKRYREIFGVLLKYGFDEILDRLKIQDYPSFVRKMLLRRQGREYVHMSRPRRLRLAIEELGPTFIKLGQMLSTRPDLVPVAYIEELKKLQDGVAPFPSREARSIIARELGQDTGSLFRSFEDRPLAAASIAQVHRATTIGGSEIVVKVQRPGIEKKIYLDMEILSDLAAIIKRRFSDQDVWDPVAIVNEFKSWITKELDFYQEARNIDRFGRNFKNDSTLRVPEVFWDLSTPSVLAMEYIDGVPVLDIDALAERGLDPKCIARNGAEAMLKQVFEHGFFHGDPHPGNIKVLENNVIVPLDYGLMGRLSDEMLEQIGDLLAGVVNRDVDAVVKVLLNIRTSGEEVDIQALKTDMGEFIDRYYEAPLYQLNTEQVMNEMFDIISQHRIRIPRDLYLMIKALVVIEGIAETLDPQFDIIAHAKPYVQKVMRRRFDVTKMAREAGKTIGEFRELVDMLPENLRHIVMKLRLGQLGVNMYHRGLGDLIREIDQSSNRLSFSLIIAALIIGSSFIMQIDRGPTLWGYPIIGFVGYLFAAVLGVWLVLSIVRSGKM